MLTYVSDLATDRRLVDDYLDRMLRNPAVMAAGPVQEAVRYAVLGAGQRLRPLLALRTARMLGAECAGTLRAAAAVELIHSASLVVDDLPSMDNSPMRRDRPSTHVAFGEPVAVLAAFAMVALAARSLLEGELDDRELRAMVTFQRRLLGTLDCSSLIAGQALDVQLTGEVREGRLREISDLKTVPLFELAMRAGAVFADLRAGREEELLRFGREFGRAYQLVDDWMDGEVSDIAEVAEQLAAAAAGLKPFGVAARGLHEMVVYLHGKAFQTDHCHR